MNKPRIVKTQQMQFHRLKQMLLPFLHYFIAHEMEKTYHQIHYFYRDDT